MIDWIGVIVFVFAFNKLMKVRINQTEGSLI